MRAGCVIVRELQQGGGGQQQQAPPEPQQPPSLDAHLTRV
jgi:hypothetical protein